VASHRSPWSPATVAAATRWPQPKRSRMPSRLPTAGYLRREEANAAILGLAKDGGSIKEIVSRVEQGGRTKSTLQRRRLWIDLRTRSAAIVLAFVNSLYSSAVRRRTCPPDSASAALAAVVFAVDL
jgi:hypothetical protein